MGTSQVNYSLAEESENEPSFVELKSLQRYNKRSEELDIDKVTGWSIVLKDRKN